jgi:apolipoprotein N-acyltransferase
MALGVGLSLVLLYGGGRLTFFPPKSETVRVASITRPDENLFPYPPSADLNKRVMMGDPLSDAETVQLRERSHRIADFLLGRAEVEAQAGAKLITYGEFNLPVLIQYEPELIRQAGDLAQRRGIYIALPLAVFNIGRHPAGQDKLVMITPAGQIGWEYEKTKLPPGEDAVLGPGSGRLVAMDTWYGRWGAAIAFDMDFPDFVRQAGRDRDDLMIVPENEYPQIDPLHSHMARYRAVENGFNLLLHASQSLSLACDYQGRIYGLMDHYHAADRVLVAQLPVRGIRTIYARGGYLFPWICMAGLALLLGARMVGSAA